MCHTVHTLIAVFLLLVVNHPAGAQGNDWLEPFPPFRIAGSCPPTCFSAPLALTSGMEAKYARLQKGEQDVFVDREGYRKFIADKSAEFQAALQKQRTAGAR